MEDSVFSRAGSVGLSPSSSAWEGLREDGPTPSTSKPINPISIPKRCCVSSLGRLEFVRPKMASKEPFRAPSSMPKVVLVRAKVLDFSTACCYADKRYCLHMMLNISPSSVLDQFLLRRNSLVRGCG